MCTLDWLNRNTYVISDLHFNHKKILDLEPIRYDFMKKLGYNTHNDMIIDMWNKTVSSDDNILILGDFAFNNIKDFINILNGNKYLIIGNHDSKKRSKYIKDDGSGFKDAFHGTIIIDDNSNIDIHNFDDPYVSGIVKNIDGYKILFSHYPINTDHKHVLRDDVINNRVKILQDTYNNNKCNINIHGHVHSIKLNNPSLINVSVEHIGMKPVQIKKLLNLD